MDTLEIPNVNEIEKIYNLKHISNTFKDKADRYINDIYNRANINLGDTEDEEFFCI